jgi:hypothetical protein
LFSPVVSWNLLEIVAFELLRSSQHLYTLVFLLVYEVFFEMRFFDYLIDF